jgi:hypothetical protein
MYSNTGLQGPFSKSNSWSNLTAAYKNYVGPTPTGGFDLYVYTLKDSGGGLPGKGYVDVTFGSLAFGTIAAAYGQDTQHVYSNSWTNAALVTPEPASLVMLASGCLALGGFCWYRRRKPHSLA